jgi:polyhydroxybutyrate depolymerase
MRQVVFALGLAACIPELPVLDDPCGEFPDPGLYKLTIETSDKGKRKPYVYVPSGAGPRHLVFMLHGAGQSPDDMELVSGWNALADREGFAVVYPAGTGFLRKLWNATDENPFTDADDVAFLDETAVVATERLCGAEVMAVGFSNGGSMVHRWGCESAWPTAIVPTEGGYLVDDCPDAPVATRIYHGTGDATVPYDGATRDGVELPSVAEVTAIKQQQNGCDATPPTTSVEGAESCATYRCDTPLVVCTIGDWNHQYPGGENTAGKQFDATSESWSWFEENWPLPQEPSGSSE